MPDFLPADWREATLVGRIETTEGPTPIMIKNGEVFDMSPIAPTVSTISTRCAC